MLAEILAFLGVPDGQMGEATRGLFGFAGILVAGLLGIFAWTIKHR